MYERFKKYKILKYLIFISSILVSTLVFALVALIVLPGLYYIVNAIINPAMFVGYNPLEGLLPATMATIWTLIISLGISVPIGILTAIYLNEYASKNKVTKIIRFSIENLAGIPSIVFGLFGAAFFVIYLQLGYSILSGSLTLAIILLPTIIITTEEALKTVPNAYREASLGLGATKYQTIFNIVIPTALPGIINAIILGIGKVIGESAALLLTMGTVLQIPTSLMDSGRTLALQLFRLSSADVPIEQMFTQMFVTAAVLLLLVLGINIVSIRIEKKYKI